MFGGLGRTIIINNSGNNNGNRTNTTGSNAGNSSGSSKNTYNSGNSGNTAATREYAEPKPLTPEQKISRAERLASEAREAKKGAVKILLVAVILLVLGAFLSIKSSGKEFEKYNLKGTVSVGYVTDDGFMGNTNKTETACKEFYEETGIPLYFYMVDVYPDDVETCDDYTWNLYDKLFKDENHVLIARYHNVNWWSWAYGENVSFFMADDEINDLIDEIYVYWEDADLSNDAVLAKGIKRYQDSLTNNGNGASMFGGLILIVGGILAVVAVFNYISKGKDAKRYDEEADDIRRDQILSQPLETFGNQEVEDLKDKYDNM